MSQNVFLEKEMDQLGSEDYLLGVDLGTMGVKASIFRLDGKLMGSFYRAIPLILLFPVGHSRIHSYGGKRPAQP